MATAPTGGTPTAPGEQLNRQHSFLLRGITNRLDGEFGSLFTRDTLDHYVVDSYEDLRSRAKVLTHLPAFVERFARQRLRALAQNRGLVTDHRPQVLFVCRRNDASSQIAAALFNARAAGRGEALSAGPEPVGELLEEAVHVLHEVGIDVLGEFPKPLTPEVEEAADVIVTLDSHDDIEILDGKQYYAWRLEPAASLAAYRELRDDLARRVDELVEAIVPPPPHGRLALGDYRQQLESDLRCLVDLVDQMLAELEGGLVAVDRVALAALPDRDDAVDRAHTDLRSDALELIARHQPVASDLRFVLAVLDAGLHLERIADGVVEATRAAVASDVVLDRPLPGQLLAMLALVADLTTASVGLLLGDSPSPLTEIEERGATLDRLAVQVFEGLLDDRSGRDRLVVLTIDRLSRLFKRAGEHAVDIAESAQFAETGQYPKLG
ncbi:MAG: PhoU domain-containing protein [Acidimicrobiales bacterium]